MASSCSPDNIPVNCGPPSSRTGARVPEKARGGAERLSLPSFPPPAAAYVHIPFCASRCSYCDFNTYADILPLAPDYAAAVCAQIRACAGQGGGPLITVYFGGGTPSLLPADLLTAILRELRQTFALAADAEVSFEANPESAEPAKLRALRETGFNRISLGMQSLEDGELLALGRIHNSAQALHAVADARDAGFANLSLDLMFGLPGQTPESLQRTLARALEVSPEHISAYCLSIEPGTPFARLAAGGHLVLPAEDTQADMFALVHRTLTDAGYEHYEISNFAWPGMRCRHNEVYWRNQSYYGFGAGAVAYVGGERVKWQPSPALYIQETLSGGGPSAVERERLSAPELLGETVMLALRTADGLDLAAASQRFGADLRHLYASQIRRFASAGLLEVRNGCLRLTPEGVPVANEVLGEFLL